MENIRKQGVKRKREHRSNTDDIASKLRGKLHHGLKEVKKASKKAKAFETQRIVKKLKDARKSGDESNIKSLEAQLECLKHIDLDDIAVRSLRSKIRKDALLSKNVDCQEVISFELSLSPLSQKSDSNSKSTSSERALVESRMLSSKILSSEVADVITSLKVVLGAERQEMSLLDDRNDTGDLQEGEEELRTTTRKTPQPEQKSERSLSEDGANESDEESNDETAWTSPGEIHDEPGDSDASAESWDSGSHHSQDDEEQETETETSHSHVSFSPRPSSSSAKKARTTTTNPPPIPKQKIGKAGESAFLPSLAVGFISGSDSEWSESEAKIADVPVKKNRRGQRARKAIWEKKYGRNANHLKKLRGNDVRGLDARVRMTRGQRGGPEKSESGRRRDSTTETAASRSRDGHRGGEGRGRGGNVRGRGRPPALREAEAPPHPRKSIHLEANRGHDRNDLHSKLHNDQARGNTREGNSHSYASNVRPGIGNNANGGSSYNVREDDRTEFKFKPKGEITSKPLHPSWEAKRRLKEKESAAIVPSMGTKIKFT